MEGIHEQGYSDSPIAKRHNELRDLILTGIDSLLDLINTGSNENKQGEALTNKLVQTIDEFETAPKLLDEDLPVYFDKLLGSFYKLRIPKDGSFQGEETGQYLRLISRIVYTFAKVRGFKHISQLFTTNVYVVPEIVELLEGLKLVSNDDELFVSLLWISNLVLVPFPLDLVGGTEFRESGLSLISTRIYNVLLQVFGKYETISKNLSIATVIMSRLLSRSDQENLMLEFLSLEMSDNLGYLMTINKLIKRMKWTDENGISQITRCVRGIIDTSDDNNYLIHYRVKLMGKLILLYSIKEDYSNISVVINYLHTIAEGPSINYDLKYTIAKAMYITYSLILGIAINYADQYLEYVWKEMIVNPQADLHQYHVALLCFGYIFLNKLGERSIESTFKLIKIISYQLYPTDDNKLSSNIREASLFCYYGFVRELGSLDKKSSPLHGTEEKSAIKTIFYDLLKLVLFDSEIYIRRCAFAVLQEFLGRLGIHLDESGEFQLKAMELLSTQGILRQSPELVRWTIDELVKLGVPKNFILLILVQKLLEPDYSNIEKKRVFLQWYTFTKSIDDLANPLQLLLNFPILDENFLVQRLSDESSLLELDTCLMILIGIGQWENQLVKRFKQNFLFNSSNDLILKGENRLHIYVHDHAANENLHSSIPSIIPIFKAVNTKGYDVEIFIKFMQTSPTWEWNYVLSIVPQHKILAESVMWHPECPLRLWFLIEDSNVHYTIRSTLIDGIASTWNLEQWDSQKKIEFAIRWLDDYTMTNQGDVGSVIRRATMTLIQAHLKSFLNAESEIMPRLVRMMGEGIDGVRKQALQLSVTLMNNEYASGSSIILEEDLGEYRVYFHWLFSYYVSCWQRWKNEFWRGIVTILGSTVGSRLLINGCFTEFYRFVLEIDVSTRVDIFSEITELMVLDLKNKGKMTKVAWNMHQKLVTLVVQLVLRIVECGLFPQTIEKDDKFYLLTRKLYVRCYNLTLGKTCDDRMISVIKIMSMVGGDDARQRVLVLIKRHKLGVLEEELEYY